jgi:hypothetical protein
MERLAAQLDPQRTLERGFSITRDAGGRLLRHPADVADGSLLISRLAGGLLRSRVQAGGGEAVPAAAAAQRTGKRPAKPAAPGSQIAFEFQPDAPGKPHEEEGR